MQYEKMNPHSLINIFPNLCQQLAEAKLKPPSHNEGNKEASEDCNDGSEARTLTPTEPLPYQMDEMVFHNFIESIPVLIYVYRGSKFIYVNPAFENALGYSNTELQNMNFWDVVHPDFKDLASQRGYARQRGGNPPQQYEIKVISKNGEEKWLDLFHSITTVYGETTIVVGAYEITEKKRLQEKLEIGEARYRAVVEDQTEMILRLSQDKKITFINEVAIRYFGFQHEEPMNTSFSPAAYEHFRAKLDQYLNLLGPDNPAVTFEEHVISANSQVWNEWNIRIIIHKKNSPCEYQIVGRNITEHKIFSEELRKARDELETQVKQRTVQLRKANQELTNVNNNLNNIINTMPDEVILVNQNFEIEILNNAFKSNFGGMVKEVQRYLKDNLSGSQSQIINKMLQVGTAFKDEEFILTTTKGDMHFLASGTPIFKGTGEVRSGLIILRPIKEIHKLVNRFSGSHAKFHFKNIIAQSDIMLNVLRLAKIDAGGESNVLIEGESGTGKELFAQAIHNEGERSNGPFIAVNCGAIPRELIGSELFGYAEGAFTGAKKGGNPGKFELASGGTIFLDEIGDMPFEQQAALLRVIEEKTVTRIGGNHLIPVDVRIVCATNKDIRQEIEKGNFRQDLYYRINVASLKIPALRERKEDIPLLFRYFVSNAKTEFSGKENFNPELLDYFINYNWPGNVRELQNVVERMLNMAAGTKLGIEHLPAEIYTFCDLDKHNCPLPSVPVNNGEPKNAEDIKNLLVDMERNNIVELLDRYRGTVSKVAKELGVSRNTVYRKIKNYDIKR